MNLSRFLQASYEDIGSLAPKTMILGAGGTRRRAELAGISAASSDYPIWTRTDMIECLAMIFRHGVQHIIAPLLTGGSRQEHTPGYSERLGEWVRWALCSNDALAEFAESGWQVRLLGGESWPEMEDMAEQLRANTARAGAPTIWFTVYSRPDLHWAHVLRRIVEQNASTHQDAIRAAYGEDIPLATLYLGTGKPDVATSVVPPLLIGNMRCYWRQHLGYDLDEVIFRKVLYDYAFTRETWRKDKSERSKEALKYRSAWESPPVLGLGFRLGSFWYPSPFSLPSEVVLEEEQWISEQ